MTAIDADEARPTSDLAAIAVELRFPADWLGEVAYAAYLETIIAVSVRQRLEHTAAKIGLSEETARRIINDQERRAELIAEAHRIIKALIPHHAEVRRLIGDELT